MEKRPVFSSGSKSNHTLLKRSGNWCAATLWLASIYAYLALPEIIPVHFSTSGKADGFGDKGTILLIPVIGTILFTMITRLARYPQSFNYVVPITEKNAAGQYRIAVNMLLYLRFAFMIIFLAIVLLTVLTANGFADGVGNLFLPLTLSLIFLPMAWFLVRSVRSR
jgi:uncharacterized membrane protein